MITIVPYKPAWPDEFAASGTALRAAVGNAALAIHHIGSTSVPGLAAKDVIDIQLTVADLERVPTAALVALGYTARSEVVRDHCPPGMTLEARELEKRYLSGKDRPIHLHVRAVGRFNQQYPLLCRDYLRSHPDVASAYAEIKRQLARYFPDDVDAYYRIKDPVFDAFMGGARDWARFTGWQSPATDA